MTLKAVDELARWQPVPGGMALRPYGEWTPYQPAADLLAAQAVENKRLREALTRIKRWHGEFPPTGRFWRELSVALHAELKRQQAFSIEKYGKIALATSPFMKLLVPAILAALEAAGFVVVPKTATAEMIAAADDQLDWGPAGYDDAPEGPASPLATYRIMLAARPK